MILSILFGFSVEFADHPEDRTEFEETLGRKRGRRIVKFQQMMQKYATLIIA